MIKNTKGNKSYTRPLPIRMLAILMAAVMVLSVLYINNSKGIVRAAGGVDNTYLGSIMILDSAKEVTDGKVFIDPGEYDVHFPIDMETTESFTFGLPKLEAAKYPTRNDESATIYKKTNKTTLEKEYSINSEYDPETYDIEPVGALIKTTCTGYSWKSEDSEQSEQSDVSSLVIKNQQALSVARLYYHFQST